MDKIPIHLVARAAPGKPLVVMTQPGSPHEGFISLAGRLVRAGKLPQGTVSFMYGQGRSSVAVLVMPAGTDLAVVLEVLHNGVVGNWYGAGPWHGVQIKLLVSEIYQAVLQAAASSTS